MPRLRLAAIMLVIAAATPALAQRAGPGVPSINFGVPSYNPGVPGQTPGPVVGPGIQHRVPLGPPVFFAPPMTRTIIVPPRTRAFDDPFSD